MKQRSRKINTGDAVVAIVVAIIALGIVFLGARLFLAVHEASEKRLDRYYYDNPLRGGGLEDTK